jgi:hypothetical protein
MQLKLIYHVPSPLSSLNKVLESKKLLKFKLAAECDILKKRRFIAKDRLVCAWKHCTGTRQSIRGR